MLEARRDLLRDAADHFTFATPDRSGFEFAQVAVTLALACPEAKTIHLVMDNLNIHCRKSLSDVYGAEMAAEWSKAAGAECEAILKAYRQ